ncbi:MAG: hypothetical protein ACE5KZ_12055 [Candidatus Scalinduaceae bacterium]
MKDQIVKLIDSPTVIEECGIAIIGIMIFRIWKDINYDLRSTNYDSVQFAELPYETSTE